MIPTIHLRDYQYELPEDRIRKHAISQRDQSKLLYYEKGIITHKGFQEITELLPTDSQLFFNNTKVIPARIHLKKSTGALIEIFLLNPVFPSSLVVEAMEVSGQCTWSCMIGNLKKWKDEPLIASLNINNTNIELTATLVNREEKLVEFSWPGDTRFVDIVEALGQVPLPPYFHREPEAGDKARYQTVYSKNEGAVAAPTAGLHFTKEVMEALIKKEINLNYLTLHVSAGTFQPVKEEIASNHPMHSEQVLITRANLESLLTNETNITVGTTSMRTLESLYWFGTKLILDVNAAFHIEKLYAYGHSDKVLPSRLESLKAIQRHMDAHQLEVLMGDTEIFIMPGYQFRMCDGLITNFHQPGSTLLMLIAAFIGEDWKALYKQAMDNGYHFLSYGDSSLLMP
jgi:S-adenosylmethionine:tRNA ribosyltransferase-isomerase